MSYAVLHIIKANSSLYSIAKHIERTAHPENADPARTHLNRYNLVEYPDGITGLAAAVEHRISNAGITRKISDRQVRCLNLVMTSDNEGMQKIIDSGKLDEWIADNIKWARDTFGGDNVVGAALHMDERTPHLHIAVVPIVTAERKKKAREATAKKRYRTKAANRPRLCADDIMERGKMSRYQDIYAEAMAKYGLERGIRGSEARHIGQHEYYPVFASFAAKAGVHLEDLFLMPENRRNGLGTKFFSEVEKFVKQDGFSYIEWSCLDWNEPAINFYNKIGAEEEHGRRYFSYSL